MSKYIKNGIVMLKRSQLHPNPDNPRTLEGPTWGGMFL